MPARAATPPTPGKGNRMSTARISTLALRGIRLIDGEQGANPGTPAAETPATGAPAEVTADTTPTAPTTLEDALAALAAAEEKAASATKHSRTWEDRAKANKTAAEKLEQMELDKLPELDRLRAQLDALTTERDTATASALKARVAASKGISEDLLVGDTEDALNLWADKLLALKGPVIPPANDTAASGQIGAPIGAAGAAITSRSQLLSMSNAEIVQAKKDGRLAELL